MGRHLVTAGSLLVAAIAVTVMAVWGMHAVTAPFGDSASAASNEPTCAPELLQIKEYLTRGEVTVSVYNTGTRKGRAGDTLTMLEAAGFRAGAVGNGKPGDHVARAEVRTTLADDPAAKLVALALGRNTPVVVSDQDYGPGVDVFIGNKFGGLDPKAAKRVKLPQAQTTCG